MQCVHQFRDEISALDSLDALADCFGRWIAGFGFYAFTIGSAPLHKGKVDSKGAVLYTTLHSAVLDEYEEQKFAEFDPLFELTTTRYLPFSRSSLEGVYASSPMNKEIWELAKRHAIGDALIFPITTVDFSRGVVIFCKDRPDDFQRRVAEHQALLHQLALAMMARSVELGFGRPACEDAPLTPREIECLQLCALGKTYQEIADSLAISERTVRFHMNNIWSKLGVERRSRAVTRAVQQGLIRT